MTAVEPKLTLRKDQKNIGREERKQREKSKKILSTDERK